MEHNEHNNINDLPTPTFGRALKDQPIRQSVSSLVTFPKSSTVLISLLESNKLNEHKNQKSKSKSKSKRKSKSKSKKKYSSDNFGMLRIKNQFEEFLQKKIILRNDYDQKNTNEFLKEKELVFDGFQIFYDEAKK